MILITISFFLFLLLISLIFFIKRKSQIEHTLGTIVRFYQSDAKDLAYDLWNNKRKYVSDLKVELVEARFVDNTPSYLIRIVGPGTSKFVCIHQYKNPDDRERAINLALECKKKLQLVQTLYKERKNAENYKITNKINLEHEEVFHTLKK